MNNLPSPAKHPQLRSFIIMPFLDRYHSNFAMFIIWVNDREKFQENWRR